MPDGRGFYLGAVWGTSGSSRQHLINHEGTRTREHTDRASRSRQAAGHSQAIGHDRDPGGKPDHSALAMRSGRYTARSSHFSCAVRMENGSAPLYHIERSYQSNLLRHNSLPQVVQHVGNPRYRRISFNPLNQSASLPLLPPQLRVVRRHPGPILICHQSGLL